MTLLELPGAIGAADRHSAQAPTFSEPDAVPWSQAQFEVPEAPKADAEWFHEPTVAVKDPRVPVKI